ncbi:hypothetical protein niasHT_033790 [Heterodera trifolii]|uniref:BTB domain-containing protein n=1 Tax=Heterodera trifolii TaxID=157864 RepID=A0ABD2J7B9_9BILA
MPPAAGNKWTKLMLSTGEYADVHFLVGDGNEKELVPAHKLILSNASDVFAAMFRFDSQNANSESASSANCPVVVVPDIEAAVFKVMLSFIYADDLDELNGANAMAVLYAAKKYNISGLVNPCLDFPITEFQNIFLAYSMARLFDLEDFANCCLAYIDKNADTLLKSEEFLQIDQKLLCEILEPEKRRQMLGPALFKIRFPLIPKEEFTKKLVPLDVLSKDEVIAVYQFHALPNCLWISDGILYQMQFPIHGRIYEQQEAFANGGFGPTNPWLDFIIDDFLDWDEPSSWGEDDLNSTT